MSKLLRPEDVKGDTAYDVILRAWLGHKVEGLPESLKLMLERWEMVDKLIRKGEIVPAAEADGTITTKHVRHNYRSVVEWIKERYKVSTRTAYEDIVQAKRFFLTCEGPTELEYGRGVRVDIGDELMFKAIEAGDFKAAALFYKETNKIIGLHERRADLPKYDDFEPPTLTVVTDPTELGFERIENKDELVRRMLNEKRSSFMEAEAVDAEELPDGD